MISGVPVMKISLRSILKTSVPIVIDLAAQMVMWAVEMSMVSRLSVQAMSRLYPGLDAKGVDAFTAVGSVVQIIMWTFTVLLIFVFGTTIIINRLIGEDKQGEANHFLGNALFTSLIPAFGIAFIWYTLAPVMFKTVLGTSPAVTALGVEYLRTIAFFSPLIIFNFVAIGIVRGAGDTHLSMITGLLVNCIHLVLAFVLIFGISIFPQLGVKGAAIAAGVGHTVGFVFTFSIILRGKSVLTFNWSDLTAPRGGTIRQVLKTGLPITLEQLAWKTGIIVILGFTYRLGTLSAASHLVILTFQRLFSILYLAFGMGALTLVGQLYGANEHRYARQTAMHFFWLVGVIVLFLAAVLYFRARYFVYIFTTDPDVVELCSAVLKVAAFIQIPKALSFIYSYSLRGIGENRYPMYLAIFGIFIIEIIGGYGLAFTLSMGLVGLWIASGIDEVIKVVLSARRFHLKLRKAMKTTGES